MLNTRMVPRQKQADWARDSIHRMESQNREKVLEVAFEFVDPIAVVAAGLVACRSKEGAVEYKASSILDRKFKAYDMCNEAIDEAVDQLIYLVALRELIQKENLNSKDN
jgi:hypothetical protein